MVLLSIIPNHCMSGIHYSIAYVRQIFPGKHILGQQAIEGRTSSANCVEIVHDPDTNWD